MPSDDVGDGSRETDRTTSNSATFTSSVASSQNAAILNQHAPRLPEDAPATGAGIKRSYSPSRENEQRESTQFASSLHYQSNPASQASSSQRPTAPLFNAPGQGTAGSTPTSTYNLPSLGHGASPASNSGNHQSADSRQVNTGPSSLQEPPAHNSPANHDSPDPAQQSSKRRRKALACYDCRRRKLKCDRAWPACSRCVKAGGPSSCRYDGVPPPAMNFWNRPGEGPSQDGTYNSQYGGASGPYVSAGDKDSTSGDDERETDSVPLSRAVHVLAPKHLGQTPTSALRNRDKDDGEVVSKSVLQARKIERLEERVALLEERGASNMPKVFMGGVPKIGGNVAKSEAPDILFFKGKAFRTQFYGCTQPTSMISQFPELRTYMKDTILQFPSLARVQSDLRALNTRAKSIGDATASDSPLMPLLPTKPATDRMVKLYLDTVEQLYRVIHVPSFQQEYAAFWEDKSQGKQDFIAIMLLMISCVVSMSSESQIRFVGKSSIARERAITWTSAVEGWLNRQSYKHTNLARYQITVLLDISKHMNSIKKKRHWETAGSLLRFGMAIGLHRNPERLQGKMTFFEDQMRRRLWYTMVEWELQAAVTRGFTAQSTTIPSDCPPPSNIDDESFGPGTVQSPPTKPATEHTDISFLHISRHSLNLRRQLNAITNDYTNPLTYEEVLSYEEKVMQEIENIPQWDDDKLPGGNSDSYHMQVALLDVQLRQFLIWLHFPFASQTDTRYSYSKSACFNAASTILDQHSKLMARGEYTLCLLRNDGYLAAMCICHNVFSSSLLRSDFVFKTLNSSFSQFVEEALKMLEEKVMRLGECRTHHWFISAAYSFVQAKVSPETSQITKQQAVDRTTKLFYRILATQEEQSRLATGALTPSVTNSDAASNHNFNQMQLPTNPGFAAVNTPQATDMMSSSMDPYEFFDLSEWALDNLWPVDGMELF